MEPSVQANGVADVGTSQPAPAPTHVAAPQRNEAKRGRGGGQRGSPRGGASGESPSDRGSPRHRRRPKPHITTPESHVVSDESEESVVTPSRRGRGRGRGGRGGRGGKQLFAAHATAPGAAPSEDDLNNASSSLPISDNSPATPTRTPKQQKSRVQEIRGTVLS
jgi:hypothetical protein